MLVPPVSRTPSPHIEQQENQAPRSFPVEWFFNEDSPPISQRRIEAIKPKKQEQKHDAKKPLLTPFVQYYENVLSKPKKEEKPV